MMAAVMGAVVTGVVALSLTKVYNSSYSVLNMTSLRNQAMQYALNGADMARSTRYDDLVSEPLDKIDGTDFYRSVTVEDDASAVNRKVATIKVFRDINDKVPLAQMVVKKSRINEVLYDTIGTNTDGAMTQEASSRLFAMSDTAVKYTAGTAVGSTTRPVYVDTDGNVKVLSGTVGSPLEPIYLQNGVFKKINGGNNQIAVTSGTIKTGEFIPVPEGFTREQCHYAVWPTSFSIWTYQTTTATPYIVVDQAIGKVTFGGNYRSYGSGSDRDVSGGSVTEAAYLCIAIK